MPSRESVPEEVRARTEFVAAVRTGIDALMGRCGYSRERAIHILLKEINRGQDSCSTWGKPTDDEVFDAMRKHKLTMDDANRAMVVSRATRREMLSRKGTTASEAIDRLIAKISLDNILYESGEDDSDDEQQNEAMAPLKIPRINRVSSSSSINPSSSSSPSIRNNNNNNNNNNNKTCSNTSHPTGTTNPRKTARNKKLTSPSPRKLQKTNHNSSTGSSSSSSSSSTSTSTSTSTILVGKKRSIEDLDASTSTADVETKAATATVRPHRASKRLHRATTTSTAEPNVSGANK